MDIINLNITGKYDLMNSLIFFWVLSMRAILFPLIDTILKKIMIKDKYYRVPSNYMLFRGVFELILLLIITPILILTSNLNFSSDIFSIKLAIIAPLYRKIFFIFFEKKYTYINKYY